MGWKKVTLGSILTESKIISDNPNPNKRIKVRLNVLGVVKRGVENEVKGATKQYIRKAGQFIFGKQNFHKGAFGIVPKELDGFESSSDLPAFDIDSSCLPEFLFYHFKSGNYYLELSKIAYGVATQRINLKEFCNLEIVLPPIVEQRLIIEKLKNLECNGDIITSELENQLHLVKQLRQAFLSEAMQGKLRLELTNKSGDKGETETGQQLLERIKAEKAQLIRDKKLKKEKELPPIKPEEIPFEIPEDWVWCRLGEVCTKIGSGSTPKGSNYSLEGRPFFRSQNIQDNGLIYSDIKYISDVIHIQMSATTVLADDLLLNITGGSLGRCALVPRNFEEGNVSQHVCIIRSLEINKVFMHRLVLSPYFQKLIFSSTTGAGREGLPKYNLEQFIIPLPPLSTQNQIVEKLDELMKTCDDLENSIKQSQLQNEQLLQQVLKEALEVREEIIL